MSERVLTQFRVVVFYMSLLLFPHPSRLNLLHHIPISQSLLEPITTLVSFFVILGMALSALYVHRRHRLFSFGILWVLITLALGSSILSLDLMFEHRLYYLPSIGFIIVASCLFSGVLPKRRRATIITSIGIILFLSAGTYVRNKVWTTPLTLWIDVLSKNPSSFKAHTNLGKILASNGFIDRAIQKYRAGLSINPNYIVARHNLGLTLVKKGLVDEAIGHYRAALRIEPRYADAHTSLGVALDKQGRIDEAIKHYSKAMRITPLNSKTHNNLGVALGKKGQTDKALRHFSEALRINPDYAEAHNNLGIILFRKSAIEGAIHHFQQALRSKYPGPELAIFQ